MRLRRTDRLIYILYMAEVSRSGRQEWSLLGLVMAPGMVACPDVALYRPGDRVGMVRGGSYGAIEASREYEDGWTNCLSVLNTEDLVNAEVVPDRFGDSRCVDASLSAVWGGEPFLVGPRSSTRIACGAAAGDCVASS